MNILLLLFAAWVIFSSSQLLYFVLKQFLLRKEGIFAQATVEEKKIKLTLPGRSTASINLFYKFPVESGEIFKGKMGITPSQAKTYKIGDVMEICYYKNNPKINLLAISLTNKVFIQALLMSAGTVAIGIIAIIVFYYHPSKNL